MLTIKIPAMEQWDELTETFVSTKEQTLQLEHSLVSISKWEAKWCKPFLDNLVEKTVEEEIDYIKCMTLTQNVDPNVYRNLSNDNLNEIHKYIESPMSATIIPKQNKGGIREIITSELIYYWMISLNIPFECQKWHINRLIKLIEVCNIKNQSPKKMSKRDIMNRNAAINAARRNKLNSKG